MRVLALLCLALLLSGCASSPHDLRMKEARAYADEGDVYLAFDAVRESLRNGGDELKNAMALLRPIENIQDRLADDYESFLPDLATFDATARHYTDVTLAARMGLIADARADELKEQAEAIALRYTLNGVFEPNFESQWDVFPALAASQDAMRLITDRSLDHLTIHGPLEAHRRPMLTRMVDFHWQTLGETDEKRMVHAALPRIEFSIAELRADVRRIDLIEAERRLDEQILDFYVGGWRSGRTVGLDVANIIQIADRYTLMQAPQYAEVVVNLVELEYRPYSETRPTRRMVHDFWVGEPEYEEECKKNEFRYGENKDEYICTQVELPQDERFYYEIEEGRDSLEWAYEIQTRSEIRQAVRSRIVRGRYDEPYHRCLNGRIRDTHGHTRSTYSFSDLDYDQWQFCEASRDRVGMGALRERMINSIVLELRGILANEHNEIRYSGNLSLSP